MKTAATTTTSQTVRVVKLLFLFVFFLHFHPQQKRPTDWHILGGEKHNNNSNYILIRRCGGRRRWKISVLCLHFKRSCFCVAVVGAGKFRRPPKLTNRQEPPYHTHSHPHTHPKMPHFCHFLLCVPTYKWQVVDAGVDSGPAAVSDIPKQT